MALTDVRWRTLPVIDAAGSDLAIGQAIGETLRDGLLEVAEAHRGGVVASIGWDTAMRIAGELMPYAEASLPHCMDELRGMAAGSGVPLDTLFSMNAWQETRFLAGRDAASPNPDDDDGCTSLAVDGDVTANGHVLLGHNEDAGTIRHALPYVVRARPDGRPAFVGFAYSGLLLYQGVNDRGIGSVGNALYFRDIRPGTPKLLAYRDVLDATFLEDAIRRTRKPERANGNNHLLANAEGDIYDVEVSDGDSALMAAEGDILAHANNVLDERMQALEWGDLLNSQMRQQRVKKLLERGRGGLTVDGIFDILSDHSNFPKSVCKHADPLHNPDVMTVASVVVDVTGGEIHVRAGYPCEAETTTVRLAG